MEDAEGNDFNSINSSRNLGHGIYKMMLEKIYCSRTSMCGYRGGCCSLSPGASCFCIALLCGPDPAQLALPAAQEGGLLWLSLGEFSHIQPDQWAWDQHPACVTSTSLSPRVVQDHLKSDRLASLSKMHTSGSCPSQWDLNPWGQWSESTV